MVVACLDQWIAGKENATCLNSSIAARDPSKGAEPAMIDSILEYTHKLSSAEHCPRGRAPFYTRVKPSHRSSDALVLVIVRPGTSIGAPCHDRISQSLIGRSGHAGNSIHFCSERMNSGLPHEAEFCYAGTKDTLYADCSQ